MFQDSFERRTFFNIDQMVYLCADAYSVEEFQEMEIKLMKALHWNFLYQTPNDCIDTFIHIFKLDLDENTHSQIQALLEFCQISFHNLYLKSSLL